MIAKTECPHCHKIHDIELKIDLNNLLEECTNSSDWTKCVFKCVVFPDVHQSSDDNHTVRDVKQAMRELEKDFLNKMIAFEETYGVNIHYIETNISGIPSRDRNNDMHTNSVLIYSDL